jgi:hypothetical protein
VPLQHTFLLRVDGDYRLPGSLERLDLGVDMLELSVAVGVVGTFAGLAVGLQAEVETLQQPPDQLLTGDEAPLGQRRGEMVNTDPRDDDRLSRIPPSFFRRLAGIRLE